MAWKIKVREVNYPSRIQVRVTFTLLKDDVAYVNDEIVLRPEELEGIADKEQLILDRISDKLKAYIATDKIFAGIEEMQDKEYDIGDKEVVMVSSGAVVAKEATIVEAKPIE
jgi:hypothetical protein